MKRRQELFVHLVWSTWDRAPLIDLDVQAWLWPMLGNESRRVGCTWAVVGGIETHVHVLCALPATLAVADLVKQIKGASARCAVERGHSLKWQAGYGAFSVSPDTVPTVEAYVRNQAEHHARNTDHDAWE
jgi:putative transposase